MTGAEIKRSALAVADRKGGYTLDDLKSQIIFGKTETIYRYGGEEFREPIADGKEAKALLARMLKLPGLPVG
jgi:hypothetical protein